MGVESEGEGEEEKIGNVGGAGGLLMVGKWGGGGGVLREN